MTRGPSFSGVRSSGVMARGAGAASEANGAQGLAKLPSGTARRWPRGPTVSPGHDGGGSMAEGSTTTPPA